jgi:hypothetical protein
MRNIGRSGIGWGMLFASLLWPVVALAQVEQTQRFEIKQKNSDEYFTIISLEEEGLALIREKDNIQATGNYGKSSFSIRTSRKGTRLILKSTSAILCWVMR